MGQPDPEPIRGQWVGPGLVELAFGLVMGPTIQTRNCLVIYLMNFTMYIYQRCRISKTMFTQH